MSAKVGMALLEELNNRKTADFWIVFDGEADLSAADQMGWLDRGRYVYARLKQAAAESQSEARELFDRKGIEYKSFWIANAIKVSGGDLELAGTLASMPAVAEILADTPQPLSSPEPGTGEAGNITMTTAPGELTVAETGETPAEKRNNAAPGAMPGAFPFLVRNIRDDKRGSAQGTGSSNS